MTKKSADDYAADILQLTVDISLLPDFHPSYEKLTQQLSRRLDKWQSLIDITYFIASNESTPWTLEGCHTEPMPLKIDSGYNQVGDYICRVNNTSTNQSSDVWVPLCVERKTKEDIYGTLLNGDRRLRFKNEISRYDKDPRFNQMVVIIECNKEDFLTYIPEVYVCTFGQHPVTLTKNLKRFFKSYYKMDMYGFASSYNLGGSDGGLSPHHHTIACTGTEHKAVIKEINDNKATLHIDGVLHETLSIKPNYGKPTLYLHRGATVKSRRSSVNKLIAKGIHIEWSGSREEAQLTYIDLVRQSIIENYKQILKLEV